MVYNRDNIDKATVARVSYVYGLSQSYFKDDHLDLDDIISICTDVAVDWANNVDIKSFEEEGYVTVYAERKLSEIFQSK